MRSQIKLLNFMQERSDRFNFGEEFRFSDQNACPTMGNGILQKFAFKTDVERDSDRSNFEAGVVAQNDRQLIRQQKRDSISRLGSSLQQASSQSVCQFKELPIGITLLFTDEGNFGREMTIRIVQDQMEHGDKKL